MQTKKLDQITMAMQQGRREICNNFKWPLGYERYMLSTTTNAITEIAKNIRRVSKVTNIGQCDSFSFIKYFWYMNSDPRNTKIENGTANASIQENVWFSKSRLDLMQSRIIYTSRTSMNKWPTTFTGALYFSRSSYSWGSNFSRWLLSSPSKVCSSSFPISGKSFNLSLVSLICLNYLKFPIK